jgi:pyruvyl transferase EpsO
MRSPAQTDPDSALLRCLADRVDAGLREVLGGARDVALVNFPNHSNPGDSAIWLGARAALRRLRVRVRYQCAWCTYSPEALRRALPHGPVLLNGGGNFGDLYRGQQGLRERLLTELTDRPIVQLPQSIHFRKQENLDRMRHLVAEHGRVTVIAREQRSEALAREHFDADVRLLPDTALALRPIRPAPMPSSEPVDDMLWLHRLSKDPEYVDHGFDLDEFGLSSREVEWIRPQPAEPAWTPTGRAVRAANGWLLARARSDQRWARHAWRPLGATFVPLGEGFVRRGLAIMATGRVLVTDKLHGHLLALLAGIPHVVLDNSYGKVSGTYQAWTHPSGLARWADSGAEAQQLVRELLDERASS